MAAISPASDGTIERLMQIPSPRKTDWLYQDYVGQRDAQIASQYASTWGYHENQIKYAPLDGEGTFYAMGTLNNQLERDVRTGFAQSVLRLRMNTFIQNALTPKAVSDTTRRRIKSVQDSLQKMKNTSVPLSKDNQGTRLALGYDVFSDASKFEILTSLWAAGIYHSHLMGQLTGGIVPTDSLSVRLSAQVLIDTSATFSLFPGAQALDASVTQSLSPKLSTRLGATLPTSNRIEAINAARGYMNLNYTF